MKMNATEGLNSWFKRCSSRPLLPYEVTGRCGTKGIDTNSIGAVRTGNIYRELPRRHKSPRRRTAQKCTKEHERTARPVAWATPTNHLLTELSGSQLSYLIPEPTTTASTHREQRSEEYEAPRSEGQKNSRLDVESQYEPGRYINQGTATT